jgi:hypothetical protein
MISPDVSGIDLQEADLQKVVLRHLRATVSAVGWRSSDKSIEQLDGDSLGPTHIDF